MKMSRKRWIPYTLILLLAVLLAVLLLKPRQPGLHIAIGRPAGQSSDAVDFTPFEPVQEKDVNKLIFLLLHGENAEASQLPGEEADVVLWISDETAVYYRCRLWLQTDKIFIGVETGDGLLYRQILQEAQVGTFREIIERYKG